MNLKPCQLTQDALDKASLSSWMWYKSTDNQEWIKAFVVVYESLILIYGGRIAFKSYQTPIEIIKLSQSTEVIDGNDMISIQGYLGKKGKYKWSNRWCALR